MALVRCCFSTVTIFLFFTGLTSSYLISGRTLLQLKKDCPVDFENKNYTVITSQCKGPRYPREQCCSALNEFACPYADELNDLNNVCSSTMFSYIMRIGGYPPGLFANQCVEGKLGLECSSDPPGSSNPNPNRGSVVSVLLVFSTSSHSSNRCITVLMPELPISSILHGSV
ncbi:GPI-anchored protein LLG1-like isoform X2 [Papaver somniferum]|uniref:GPI-anchored protein LLG1-like isoform X2 n=1 Tax=Papaver somniferum TaxID=3469 RepID=UPI000E703083|nr:GPI-anchored protein LLG1-like isoform X2 [Papaver somniferum]